jgi:hypothetical protein
MLYYNCIVFASLGPSGYLFIWKSGLGLGGFGIMKVFTEGINVIRLI